MGFFSKFGIGMRALTFLRRIAICTERIAISQETIASLALDDFHATHRTRKGKPTEISMFDQDAASTRYLESVSDREG